MKLLKEINKYSVSQIYLLRKEVSLLLNGGIIYSFIEYYDNFIFDMK